MGNNTAWTLKGKRPFSLAVKITAMISSHRADSGSVRSLPTVSLLSKKSFPFVGYVHLQGLSGYLQHSTTCSAETVVTVPQVSTSTLRALATCQKACFYHPTPKCSIPVVPYTGTEYIPTSPFSLCQSQSISSSYIDHEAEERSQLTHGQTRPN